MKVILISNCVLYFETPGIYIFHFVHSMNLFKKISYIYIIYYYYYYHIILLLYYILLLYLYFLFIFFYLLCFFLKYIHECTKNKIYIYIYLQTKGTDIVITDIGY